MIKEPNNDDDDEQWSTITGYRREQSTDAEFSLRMTIEKRRGGVVYRLGTEEKLRESGAWKDGEKK